MNIKNKETASNKFTRMHGEFEKRGYEPLPPTPISHKATKLLQRWGLNQTQIDNLRLFTAQFRYDLCLQKVARLTRVSAYLSLEDDIEFISFPNFYDTGGRFDGQCRDISEQWIVQMKSNGLYQSINASTNHKHKIIASAHRGLSPTHFCKHPFKHLWNGLSLVTKNNELIDQVYFDASFQDILLPEEKEYKPNINFYEPKIDPDSLVQIPVGKVQKCQDGLILSANAGAFIGMSNERTHGFSLGFVKDLVENDFKPIVATLDEHGNNERFIYGYNEPFDQTKLKKSLIFEIRQLLNTASKIKIVKS